MKEADIEEEAEDAEEGTGKGIQGIKIIIKAKGSRYKQIFKKKGKI